jgi:hypothetical protein
VYPNPNKGSFTLETDAVIGSEYHVYDMLGSLVHHGLVHSSHQPIDMSAAHTGIYTLVIRDARATMRFGVE